MTRRWKWLVLVVLAAVQGRNLAREAPAAGTAVSEGPVARASPETRPAARPRPEYTTRAEHDPEGIGKFYMGREIAHVMGHEAAPWLERRERERQEQAGRMLASLKIRKGDVVADIGAGSGYHTIRLARWVGPKGRVLALDIQQEMLNLIERKLRRERLRNVELVLGEPDDPKLPANSLDLALMVDVYHEFEWPYEMMEHIVAALKPGGRVAFVEYKLEDPRIPIKRLHKMSEAQVLKEMEPFPLRHVETVRTLPWQQVIILEKPVAATRPGT